MKEEAKKVVLAYSGGLDTSVIVPWLKENYGCEVITFTAHLGQEDELEGLEEKALASGASKAYIVDLQEEFLTEYAFPTMQAGAIYERLYLLGTSFARPVTAKKMVEIAEMENADAVAHGCTGKGNDQVRFELTVKALNPFLRTIAPWREWEIRSREDALAYARAHNVPVAATEKSIYSRDSNIWHMSHEGGILEYPWAEPEEDMFTRTVAPEAAPDTPLYLTIGFEKGVPVAIDDEPMGPVQLLASLNDVAGAHGVGRADLVENRLIGMKSRGVYETPGGTVLYAVHQALESICLDRDTLHYKLHLGLRYAELVYNGLWFTPLREAMDAFVGKTQERVTGTARIKLYKGSCTVVGRKSPFSLYREDLATFGKDDVYDQSDAAGFINLFGLPLTVRALIAQEEAQNAGLQAPDFSRFKRD